VVAAYGVVLYTNIHPHIHKVVEDNDYCKALNELSGDRWVLFAVRAKPGHETFPKPRPGTTGLLTVIWHEPEENRRLLEALGMDSTEGLPCLLMLFPDSHGQTATLTIKLIDGASVGEAYASLKHAVELVTDAINQLRPEHLQNAEGIENAVRYHLQNERDWKILKKAISFILWAKEHLS